MQLLLGNENCSFWMNFIGAFIWTLCGFIMFLGVALMQIVQAFYSFGNYGFSSFLTI